MGCGCGKKRMAQYSSNQLRSQASGESTVVASAPAESTSNSSNSTVDNQRASHGAAR